MSFLSQRQTLQVMSGALHWQERSVSQPQQKLPSPPVLARLFLHFCLALSKNRTDASGGATCKLMQLPSWSPDKGGEGTATL